METEWSLFWCSISRGPLLYLLRASKEPGCFPSVIPLSCSGYQGGCRAQSWHGVPSPGSLVPGCPQTSLVLATSTINKQKWWSNVLLPTLKLCLLCSKSLRLDSARGERGFVGCPALSRCQGACQLLVTLPLSQGDGQH